MRRHGERSYLFSGQIEGIFSAGNRNKSSGYLFGSVLRKVIKMNLLRQILFTAVVVFGFSLTASAQRQPEEKKKPPKENAEIKPEENKKPKNNDNPRNNENRENKPKKPQTFFLLSENRIEITST
jgi:hypothetical protein